MHRLDLMKTGILESRTCSAFYDAYCFSWSSMHENTESDTLQRGMLETWYDTESMDTLDVTSKRIAACDTWSMRPWAVSMGNLVLQLAWCPSSVSCVYLFIYIFACRDAGQCAKTVHGRILYSNMYSEIQVQHSCIHVHFKVQRHVQWNAGTDSTAYASSTATCTVESRYEQHNRCIKYSNMYSGI